MASKASLVLGVLLATVLLVASEAMQPQQHQEKKANYANVVDQKYGGYPGGGFLPRNGYGPGRGRCNYGCCRPRYYGGCRCCANANDMPDAEYLPEPHY